MPAIEKYYIRFHASVGSWDSPLPKSQAKHFVKTEFVFYGGPGLDWSSDRREAKFFNNQSDAIEVANKTLKRYPGLTKYDIFSMLRYK
jgi:hypothetical protein